MDIEIKQAASTDAKEILALQKLVFQNEGEICSHCSVDPLTQTLEDLTSELKKKIFLKAVADGRIAGSVRGFRGFDHPETCYIERLMTHPSFQGQGIGTKLMEEIERYFEGRITRFQLSTGYKNERNIHLYQKLGYKIYKTDKVSDEVTFVYMEKYKT